VSARNIEEFGLFLQKETVLAYALYYNKQDLIKSILRDLGPDIEFVAGSYYASYTPLMFAVHHRKAKTVQFLLETYPNLDILKELKSSTALSNAIMNDDNEIVAILLQHINELITDSVDKAMLGTCLAMVVKRNNVEMARLFLRHQHININQTVGSDKMPIQHYAETPEMLNLLLNDPRLIDRLTINTAGRNALHWASIFERVKLIPILLQQGFPLRLQENLYNKTALEMALYLGKDSGSEKVNRLSCIIQLAAAEGKWEIVSDYISRLSNEMKDEEDALYYGLALLQALEAGEIDIAKSLIESGGEGILVDEVNRRSIFDYLSAENRQEFLQKLEPGALSRVFFDQTKTKDFSFDAFKPNVDIFSKIKTYYDFYAKFKSLMSSTPLHDAIFDNNEQQVEFLLERGLLLNGKIENKKRPIELAVTASENIQKLVLTELIKCYQDATDEQKKSGFAKAIKQFISDCKLGNDLDVMDTLENCGLGTYNKTNTSFLAVVGNTLPFFKKRRSSSSTRLQDFELHNRL